MKISKYNYIVEGEKGNYIIYNSLSKRISIVSEKTAKALSNKQMVESINSGSLNELVKCGYILPNEYDEKEIVDFRYIKDISDSRLDLTLMPTEECNFCCKYCYENFKKGVMSNEIQESLLLFLKKNLRKYTGLSVSWFGGEPTLAIDVIKYLSANFLELCKKIKIPYYAGITTNGYLLSEDNFRILLSCRVRHFQITLDGLAQYHNKFKRTVDNKDTYEKVLQNLRNIKRKFPSDHFSITIRTNVSMDMLDDLEEVINFYKIEFGDDKRFTFYFRPVGNWGGERVKKIEQSVFQNSQYSIVYSKIASVKTALDYRMYYLELTKNIDICYAARLNSYIIGMDGIIYKCSTIFNEEINKVGLLQKNGEMFLDEEKIAKWSMIGIKTINKDSFCSECQLLGSCHNSTCIADQVRGKSEHNCPHLKDSIKEILKLVVKESKYIDYIEEKTYEN